VIGISVGALSRRNAHASITAHKFGRGNVLNNFGNMSLFKKKKLFESNASIDVLSLVIVRSTWRTTNLQEER
jgi:hypothetical protein